MIIVVLCAYSKIQLVIAILKTAAVFMADNPRTLFLPPFFGLVTIIFWVLWMVAITYVYSSGDIVPGGNPFASVRLE
jgi:hypothetical protein